MMWAFRLWLCYSLHLLNFVKKKLFSSQRPVFIISLVFREEQNPLERWDERLRSFDSRFSVSLCCKISVAIHWIGLSLTLKVRESNSLVKEVILLSMKESKRTVRTICLLSVDVMCFCGLCVNHMWKKWGMMTYVNKWEIIDKKLI